MPKIIAQVFDSLDKVKTSVFDNGKEKKMRLIKIVKPINKNAVDKSWFALYDLSFLKIRMQIKNSINEAMNNPIEVIKIVVEIIHLL